ncbi:MAG: hypothetical protein NVS9B4_04560 [Candidatus Acidiferrum sp.]
MMTTENYRDGQGDVTRNDTGRKWLWRLLAVAVALQLYFVRELLAAFALFSAGFAVIAAVIGGFYLLQKGWEVGVERLAESQNGIVLLAKRGVSVVEDLGRRPFRRPV